MHPLLKSILRKGQGFGKSVKHILEATISSVHVHFVTLHAIECFTNIRILCNILGKQGYILWLNRILPKPSLYGTR